ncbi:MAG: hypothetical protein IPK58_13355 [Acidobacteria bacterium]|nr:hypothetical protein [Acidobacteriota bacterium]
MKYFASLIVATAAIFVFSGGIRAQGVVVPIICEFRPCRPIPRPMPVPLPNALPVKSIELDTRIEGQIATTHLVQVFRKRHALHARRNVLLSDTRVRLDNRVRDLGKRQETRRRSSLT